MDAITAPLCVTGVQRAPSASLLIVSTNRPATPEEAAGVLGTLRRHVNGDGAPGDIIRQEDARWMLNALRTLQARLDGWQRRMAPLSPDHEEGFAPQLRDIEATHRVAAHAIARAEGR